MPPLVSIIIPAYNAEPWIDACLRSALGQTYPNCEIIVIDDGSSDSTLNIARSYESRSLHVSSQSNAGASAARNHGLRLAQGKFIQYLDADDLLAPDKIALQIAGLETLPPHTLATGSWGRFVNDPASTHWPREAVYAAQSGVEFLQIHYETGSMMQPGAWFAPRTLLNLAGPWNESLSLNDDGEYFARVMLQASALYHVPEARCYYRQSPVISLSRRRDAAALSSLHRSVELTIGHLLAADRSERSRAAAVRAWRGLAYELYPDVIPLARASRNAAAALGGPSSPLGGPAWLAPVARIIGWNLARRLQHFRNRLS